MPLAVARGQVLLVVFRRMATAPPAGLGCFSPRAWARTMRGAHRQSRASLPSMVPCRYAAWWRRLAAS
eukprot:11192652-Lingulodinium_polyedra.AAC.1